MAKLIYSAMMSLDGYVADVGGSFDWAAPDAEAHTFANELERQLSTNLYGRRIYEVMSFWENEANLEGAPEYIRDYGALWRAADKIVFSRSLEAPNTSRTRLEREFSADFVTKLKAQAGQDISIGGPTLAAHAFRAELVDECHFFLAPASVGAGLPALPTDLRLRLDLMDQRSFSNGMAYLHYRVRPWE